MKVPLTTRPKAFTLVELLVSMAIIALMVLVMVSITDSTRKTWSYTNSKIEQFREAREAFESITRKLSQATLNTYWDYAYRDSANPTTPTDYIRQSELRFISGNAQALSLPANVYTHGMFFQAPLGYVSDTTNYKGLENLLNTWGYFVEYADDSALRPLFLNQPTPTLVPYRKRFRLMEMMEPSEKLTLYQAEVKAGGNSNYTGKDWFITPLPNYKQVRAENIIALIILPKLSPADQNYPTVGSYKDYDLAPTYLYDSTGTNSDANLNPKNQLPPIIQVSMVALDEVSASRMTDAAAVELQTKLNELFTISKDQLKDLRLDPINYPDSSSDPSLEAYLISKKYNYRIFTTNVSIKAAKWSRSQKN